MTNNRRNFLRQLITASAWLGTIRIGLPTCNTFAVGDFPPPRGIVKITGSVTLNGTLARTGMAISAGDTLTTAADAQVIFTIGLDAFLLRENARLTIPKNENTTNGQFNLNTIKLDAGGLLAVFKPGAKRRLITTTAIAGVRGTALYAEVLPERTYLCTCYGEVELAARDYPGKSETVSTRHHESPRYIYGGSARKPVVNPIVAAGVFNHSDEELVMLERLAGRTPPFGESSSSAY